MSYIYEFGYGTCEESAAVQVSHRRKFSQSRFENMLITCTVEAARMERDLHIIQWEKDWFARHDFEADECSSDVKSFRVHELESAIKWRLLGNEDMYHNDIKGAKYMENPRLTYQELHKIVVHLMCQNYGFQPVNKLRCAYYFGWSDLSVKRDWDTYDTKGSITQRTSRLVRKLVLKSAERFGRSSAASKWIASRKRAIGKNPAGCDIEDEILCKELGVEFIPHNHPDAVLAREAALTRDKDFIINIEDELLRAFGADKD